MYYVYYGDRFLLNPYDDYARIHDGKMSGDVNDTLTFEFTVPPSHPLYGALAKRDYENPVKVEFDGKELFRGYIEELEQDINTEIDVSCKSDMAMLGDTLLRPYTTDSDEAEEDDMEYVGGTGFADLFEYYIDSHNENCTYIGSDGETHGTEKRFTIRYPSESGTSLSAEGEKLDAVGSNYRSSTQLPTVLDELQDKILDSLGAYVQVWYDGDTRCISLYADVPDFMAEVQTIELGGNITDMSLDDTVVDTYTAIRPTATVDSDDEEGEQETITIESLDDGVYQTDYYKQGDVVYNMAAVEEYGYREYAWSESEATTASTLLTSAITELKTLMVPTQGIDVEAVDMAFVDSAYEHLMPGQSVRVISTPHNIDMVLTVTACDIDFDSPGSTKYTFGSDVTTITKTYGSVMKEVSLALNTATSASGYSASAFTSAKSASAAASAAIEAAASATVVTVTTQVSQLSTSASGTVVEPGENVGVVSASMAATGSMRQVSVQFGITGTVSDGDTLGTLVTVPTVEVWLESMHIETDGTIVADREFAAGEYAYMTATFVTG